MSTTPIRSNQRGMVSFMVTLIMMLVITLIVLGFAQVTRRNEREALDRQLSAQAFYAAESGINVAREALASFAGATPATKTTCSNDYNPAVAGGVGASITPLDTGVRYSCVLVDPSPDSLVVDAIQTGSVILPLNTTGPLSTLTFAWPKQPGAVNTNCNLASQTALPPLSGGTPWACGNGIVRVELMTTPAGGWDNNVLDANTKVIYLTPQGPHSGVLNVTGASKVYVGSASNCAATCQVTVTVPASASYYARITSIYRNAPGLSIIGTLGAGGRASFIGAQAVIDVTGQAQDQLRRVQARVALANLADSNQVPLAALSSNGDICKHFTIVPGANVNTSNVCL